MTDWSAIGGATLGVPGFIGGSIFGKKKKKAKKPDTMAELVAKMWNEQTKLGGLAESQQKKALGGLEQGYGSALANLGSGASAAKQSVLNNQTQMQGALQQQLASSGLGNTTTNANLAAGLGAQGSQKLGEIDMNLAQMMAQLQTQKAQAMYGAQTGLGDFYSNQFGQKMGVGGMQMDNHYQRKAGQKGKGGSGLGGMLGGVAGSFFGPLGGMAGSQLGSSLFGGGGGGGAGGGLGGYGGGQFNPLDYMQYQ